MSSKAKSPVIVFAKVTKRFEINRENTLKWGLPDLFSGKKQKFTALKDVSFSVYAHEIVGLYGPNGSGKSVILKLMAGILKPDSGKVSVLGKVAPVIELGAGLHPELSGRENIYLYSSILGVSRSEAQKHLDTIIDFAGVREFIETPIKKYSSGMTARLGFAIAVYAKPDILLIDEVFAVGDAVFQAKCEETLKKLQKEMTVIVTSHNVSLLNKICDRVLLMNQINKTYATPDIIKFISAIPESFSFQVEATTLSMQPVINPGDLLTVKKMKFKSLKKGEVIAFYDGIIGSLVVHRIIQLKRGKQITLITQGDNSPLPDPFAVRELNYIGQVIKINGKNL